MHCLASDYAAAVPPKVNRTKQHTVAVDEELWNDCLLIAGVRREVLSQLLRQRLYAYREENATLLAAVKAAQSPSSPTEMHED